ncbi:MAG: NAD(P)H-hydrate dehydratase [Kiritimatiellia bacterium]|jgi:hydroxyethylthiazole kinase-like uncharacterized protein yjeF
MRCVTSQEMRERDRRAIEGGTPGWTLMRRAAFAVARAACRLANLAGIRDIVVLAGRGNNGGDGCVAARLLRDAGFRARLWLAARPESLAGDARTAFDFLDAGAERGPSAPVPVRILPEAEDWEALEAFDLPCAKPLVIDALLGTGAHGALREPIDAAVRFLERVRRQCNVLAIDLPTGVDADTGEVLPHHVVADWTVTLAAPKIGMTHPAALAALGHVDVADIGLGTADAPGPQDETIPGILVPAEHGNPESIRRREAHKGDFGHVLIAGGSIGFGGAPALAALGALRSGAGLVSAIVPMGAEGALAAWAPEAMAHPLPSPNGWLAPAALLAWGRNPAEFDVLVAGPGLRKTADTADLVRMWLADESIRRILLDADALNVLEGALADEGCAPLSADPGRLVLTPHPGEAARLLGVPAAEVQMNRVEAVRTLARRANAAVVLKGAGSLVCIPNGTPLLNLTGNPGMATGGSGDVLAGVIAAHWAAGADALDAAALGVALHGTAGDEAACRKGQRALLARDIAEALGGSGR